MLRATFLYNWMTIINNSMSRVGLETLSSMHSKAPNKKDNTSFKDIFAGDLNF